jgi:hypothetical protein
MFHGLLYVLLCVSVSSYPASLRDWLTQYVSSSTSSSSSVDSFLAVLTDQESIWSHVKLEEGATMEQMVRIGIQVQDWDKCNTHIDKVNREK